MITKLVVEEFEATGKEENVAKGYKYSFFRDPKTGKFYRPKKNYQVTGDNLEEFFEEITDEN